MDSPDRAAANEPRRPPLLGGAIARNCTRWLGDHNCGKPAVRHVLWDATMENGFVCQEHLAEIGTVWSYYAIHEVGADCAMPGSLFFEELNVHSASCGYPDMLCTCRNASAAWRGR